MTSLIKVCFPAGTPIFMLDGTPKTVEQIAKGNRVPAVSDRNPEGPISMGEVVEVIRNGASALVAVEFAGRVVKATPWHAFYVIGRGFIAAEKLVRGDLLRSASGASLPVTSVAPAGRAETVYNFQVRDLHTYFVGDSAETAVLVHNDGCGSPGDPKTRDQFERQEELELEDYISKQLAQAQKAKQAVDAAVQAMAKVVADGNTQSSVIDAEAAEVYLNSTLYVNSLAAALDKIASGIKNSSFGGGSALSLVTKITSQGALSDNGVNMFGLAAAVAKSNYNQASDNLLQSLGEQDAKLSKTITGLKVAQTLNEVAGWVILGGTLVKVGLKGGVWAVTRTAGAIAASMAAGYGSGVVADKLHAPPEVKTATEAAVTLLTFVVLHKYLGVGKVGENAPGETPPERPPQAPPDAPRAGPNYDPNRVPGPNPNNLRQRPVTRPTKGEGGAYYKPQGGKTKAGSTGDFYKRYGPNSPEGIQVEVPQTRDGPPPGVDDSAHPWNAREQRRFDEEYMDRLLPPDIRYRDPSNPMGPVSQEKWEKYRQIFGYGDLPANFGNR